MLHRFLLQLTVLLAFVSGSPRDLVATESKTLKVVVQAKPAPIVFKREVLLNNFKVAKVVSFEVGGKAKIAVLGERLQDVEPRQRLRQRFQHVQQYDAVSGALEKTLLIDESDIAGKLHVFRDVKRDRAKLVYKKSTTMTLIDPVKGSTETIETKMVRKLADDSDSYVDFHLFLGTFVNEGRTHIVLGGLDHKTPWVGIWDTKDLKRGPKTTIDMGASIIGTARVLTIDAESFVASRTSLDTYRLLNLKTLTTTEGKGPYVGKDEVNGNGWDLFQYPKTGKVVIVSGLDTIYVHDLAGKEVHKIREGRRFKKASGWNLAAYKTKDGGLGIAAAQKLEGKSETKQRSPRSVLLFFEEP